MGETKKIQVEQWDEFLPRLGNRFRDRKTRIEVEGADIGSQELAEMPLIGISYDKKGSGKSSVEISLSAEPPEGPMTSHVISHPTQIYAELDETGEVDCLEIEDEDNRKTLIFFERQEPAPAG